MIHIRTIKIAAVIALVSAYAGASAVAQTQVNFSAAGPAAWSTGSNWDTFEIPASQFNEFAVIGGGRSAFVNNTPPSTGAIVVSDGTLEVRSGGNLTAASNSLVAGNLVVGEAGNGSVIVRRGGTLNVQTVALSGGASSELTLGEVGGSGTASFTTTGGTLSRVTRIVGPSVTFNAAGNLSFSSPGILVPVITGNSHSSINVAGNAILGGKVRPEFSGYTPTLNDSWNIVTAATLAGSFALDLTSAPATPRGTGFSVRQTATTSTLQFTNQLILTVNRATGQTKIENILGSPIQFDGYSIASPGGYLGGAWNSLEDQNVSHWDEAANSTVNRLTEFNQSASSSVNVGASLSLGTPFSPPVPAALGQSSPEDLLFTYAVPGQGVVEGVVEYTGRRNNVVLTINPATGAAAIQNESPFFDVAIEAYTVTSTSGRLSTSAGTWNSLQDQALSGWDEADNSNNFRLTEFNPDGETLLPGGGTVLNLGSPINIAGGPLVADDFHFEFALANGEVMAGIVSLGALPTAVLRGDYDQNGVVNATDYTTWKSAFGNNVSPGSGADGNGNGVVDAADYTVWRDALSGGSGAAVALPVPEPSVLTSVIAMLMIGASWRRERSWKSGEL